MATATLQRGSMAAAPSQHHHTMHLEELESAWFCCTAASSSAANCLSSCCCSSSCSDAAANFCCSAACSAAACQQSTSHIHLKHASMLSNMHQCSQTCINALLTQSLSLTHLHLLTSLLHFLTHCSIDESGTSVCGTNGCGINVWHLGSSVVQCLVSLLKLRLGFLQLCADPQIPLALHCQPLRAVHQCRLQTRLSTIALSNSTKHPLLNNGTQRLVTIALSIDQQ